MALIQAARSQVGQPSARINGAINEQYVIEEDFEENTLTLTLSETPWDPDTIVLDYNGQVKRLGTDWNYTAPTTIEIVFGDPYVTTYDTPPYFQVTYLY